MTSDFQRHPTTGAPYIVDPNGKKRQYGRASSATKDLDDDTALQNWIQRRVLLGGVLSDEVFRMVTEANSKHELDSREWKDAMDEAIELAITVAKGRIAAERGTYAHSLVEADEHDAKLGSLIHGGNRYVSEEEVKSLVAGGLSLGIPVTDQDAIVRAWREVLEKFDLEVLTQEHRVVADRWRLAGTLDAIFRLGRELTFRHASGEIIRLPKGLVICGDLKGLAIDTPIPTPSGWSTMGDLAVGDAVFGSDGKQCSITRKSDVSYKRCFRLVFDNTEEVIADHEHIWAVTHRHHGKGVEKLMTTEQIFEVYSRDAEAGKPNRDIMRITLAAPIDCAEVDLPVDPYVLGCWLGDGHKRGGTISKPMQSMRDEITDRGFVVTVQADQMAFTPHGLVHGLRELDLINNKHVPEMYLRASESQRIDLLRGLMDSDGTWNKARNSCTFSSTDDRLASAVHELVCSLGMRAIKSKYKASGFGLEVDAYAVSFTPTWFIPFLAKQNDCVLSDSVRSRTVFIKSIEEVDSVVTQCIAVDSPDNTYLFGKTMLVTHNTGMLRRDGKGMPQYWDGYCGQVTAYANSVPYNVATSSRENWPEEWGEMDDKWAIIVHISVQEVLSGQPTTAELILVDLEQGIEDLDLARRLKDNRKAQRFGVLGPDEPLVLINPEGNAEADDNDGDDW